MTCWLDIQRATGIDRREVKPGGHIGTASGACPGCGIEPFHVQGSSPHRMPDDRTIRSGGHCVTCGDAVGWLYAQPDTMFGLEEDERVLNGRARVYG
jgi:hypothetical protein